MHPHAENGNLRRKATKFYQLFGHTSVGRMHGVVRSLNRNALLSSSGILISYRKMADGMIKQARELGMDYIVSTPIRNPHHNVIYIPRA